MLVPCLLGLIKKPNKFSLILDTHHPIRWELRIHFFLFSFHLYFGIFIISALRCKSGIKYWSFRLWVRTCLYLCGLFSICRQFFNNVNNLLKLCYVFLSFYYIWFYLIISYNVRLFYLLHFCMSYTITGKRWVHWFTPIKCRLFPL